jgi:hypothetical protein
MKPLNTNLLLASGAIEGPARPVRPVTLTLRTRLCRWLRNLRSKA